MGCTSDLVFRITLWTQRTVVGLHAVDSMTLLAEVGRVASQGGHRVGQSPNSPLFPDVYGRVQGA